MRVAVFVECTIYIIIGYRFSTPAVQMHVQCMRWLVLVDPKVIMQFPVFELQFAQMHTEACGMRHRN